MPSSTTTAAAAAAAGTMVDAEATESPKLSRPPRSGDGDWSVSFGAAANFASFSTDEVGGTGDRSPPPTFDLSRSLELLRESPPPPPPPSSTAVSPSGAFAFVAAAPAPFLLELERRRESLREVEAVAAVAAAAAVGAAAVLGGTVSPSSAREETGPLGCSPRRPVGPATAAEVLGKRGLSGEGVELPAVEAVEAGGNGREVFTGAVPVPPTCGGPDRLLLGRVESPSPAAALFPVVPECAARDLLGVSDDELVTRVAAAGARDRQVSAFVQSSVAFAARESGAGGEEEDDDDEACVGAEGVAPAAEVTDWRGGNDWRRGTVAPAPAAAADVDVEAAANAAFAAVASFSEE